MSGEVLTKTEVLTKVEALAKGGLPPARAHFPALLYIVKSVDATPIFSELMHISIYISNYKYSCVGFIRL